MIQRSSEEIAMVTSEMENTLEYYINQSRILGHCIHIYAQSKDSYSRGSVALLKNMLIRVDNNISECKQLFSVTGSKGMFYDSECDTVYDSDSEDECSNDDC